jgi:hypothetical protein
MKRFILILVISWLLQIPVFSSTLTDYLKQFPEVVTIQPMAANSFFTEAVQIKLRQPVDHKNPMKGSFTQRVFISVLTTESPVVLVTEGYAANYGANQAYVNELCRLVNSSQIVVEHRYFGQSWPDPLDWEYLSVENAASDHHKVVQLLKPFLSGTWINTGISKGGQTALLHRAFYPNDVDVTVSYVAPFNFGVEDGRHEPYIKNVPGTQKQRKLVEAFQKELLKRRNTLMPLFENLVKEKNFTFNAGLEEIFDFCVLEYSFAFWQWGTNPNQIPSKKATDEEVFAHFTQISGPDYFSLEGLDRIGSFFVQAARELGYYGYDTRPFKRHLTIKTAENYLERLFLPAMYRVEFDDTSVKLTNAFLETTDARMIFIYGKNDPWTASGVIPPSGENFVRIVQSGASHGIRIAGLDQKNKEKVLQKLTDWVAVLEQVNLIPM